MCLLFIRIRTYNSNFAMYKKKEYTYCATQKDVYVFIIPKHNRWFPTTSLGVTTRKLVVCCFIYCWKYAN